MLRSAATKSKRAFTISSTLMCSRLKDSGADETQISGEISGDIQSYFEKYTCLPNRPENFNSIQNLVGTDIVCAVDQILADAEEKLGRSFNNNVRYGLAVHIYSSISRIRQGRKTVNPKLNEIRKDMPGEFSVALDGLKIISRKFNVEMPIDEAGFLAVFFDLNHLRHHTRVLVIVIAHGKTTATSMAEAANRLLGNNYALGLNASLDEKPQDVYFRLKELVKSRPASSGLLLLVDMGSLTNFASDIQQELGIQTKVIPLVSTLHVLEAARKASLGYPLDYVYQETSHVGEQFLNAGLSTSVKEKLAKAFIVAICTTGEGSAMLLKKTLDSRLNYHDSFCETITLKLTDKTAIEDRLHAIEQIGRVLCLVGVLSGRISCSVLFDFRMSWKAKPFRRFRRLSITRQYSAKSVKLFQPCSKTETTKKYFMKYVAQSRRSKNEPALNWIPTCWWAFCATWDAWLTGCSVKHA